MSFALCSLASTPAMFNSTITEDDAFLCPVDGAIMITGSLLCYSSIKYGSSILHMTKNPDTCFHY